MTTRKQWQARGMKRPPPKAHVDIPTMTFTQWVNEYIERMGYEPPTPIDQEKFAREYAEAIAALAKAAP